VKRDVELAQRALDLGQRARRATAAGGWFAQQRDDAFHGCRIAGTADRPVCRQWSTVRVLSFERSFRVGVTLRMADLRRQGRLRGQVHEFGDPA